MDPLSIAAIGWLMSALVSKAVSALLEAWAKRIGLGNEFKTLNDQLKLLNSLLTSTRHIPIDNSSLEELVQDLQHLAYRAENLLDELDYYRLEDEIQHRAASSSSGFRLACHSILSSLKEISCHSARDVTRNNLSPRMKKLAEELKKSVEEVSNAVRTEASAITTQKTEATQSRQTTSFVTESRVFGRDQEHDQLIMNLLTNEESAKVDKVPVLAIVGSGGVGKTTLAQLVFKHPKVCRHFHLRFWIYVSTGFDIGRLTREMLEVACGNRYDKHNNLDLLQTKLKDELVSKRFLLVLDDMWEDKEKSQWDKMVAPLNEGMEKGSIILVTTRKRSVAKMVDARDDIIYLQGLENDEFLKFFSTCIFSNDENYGGDWRLRQIGQEIADKLKCNPLAAKTAGALLRDKPRDVSSWIKIRDSEDWISQSGPDDIMPALRASYECMPFYLQRCFSYCAMLPEDHTFTCEKLVYLWMAQDFLYVRSEGQRMEDIGHAYFNDLLNHGFFQSKPSAHDGVVHYTFHDHLLHHFARMVSFEECLRINGTEPRQIIPPTIRRSPTIRHLSIFNCTGRGEEEIGSALGSLEKENLSTVFNWDELPSGIFLEISNLLKDTKFLRAVTLNLHTEVQLHSVNFKNFVSLRYLRLIMSNCNTCQTLPREICRLYHLEVFEIEGGNIAELPNNFSDLVSLRHFIVKEDLHSKIWAVGKLTSLQGLNYFDVQQKKGFEIEQLGSLTEIGGLLHIRKLENVKSKAEASKARLAEKEKLDALYLKWDHGKHENQSVLEGLKPSTYLKSLTIVGYGGVASPTWLEPSLVYLESLTLEGCKAWELLPPLGELEFLKHLELSGMAAKEIGSQCYGTSQSMKFRSLEELKIVDMQHLKKWVGSDQLQLFLCLKELTIEGCSKLEDLPLSGCATSEVLKRFPSLESLKIKGCPKISQLPPLPYSSLLSFISIETTEFIKSMLYKEERQNLSLILDQNSSLKLGELLAFHELSSLRVLEISYLVDIRGYKRNLQSFPFDLFPSLKDLRIKFPGIQSLPTNSHNEITRDCLKLRNIKKVDIFSDPVQIEFVLSSEEMICQQMDAVN